jgi:lysophospholipase L1-like esterase
MTGGNVKAIALALLALLVLPTAGGLTTTTAASSTQKKKKKKKKKRATRAPIHVSAAQRAAAVDEVTHDLASPLAFDNPAGLIAFFEALYQAGQHPASVHVLQFGDSHTASDDWVNAMRQLAQAKFGDGGPGFVFPGQPFRGYRRHDAHGSSSYYWHTDGTTRSPGDGRVGLGVSIETSRPGQTVTLDATGARATLYYLQVAGGGVMNLSVDGADSAEVVASGDSGLGVWTHDAGVGPTQYMLRTVSPAPVRILGWAVDNPTGITWETMGINGAQAGIVNGWDDPLFAAMIASRAPALVILAYGTNEALSRSFSPAEYGESFGNVVRKVRRAAPLASILVVGPPDCYLRRRRSVSPFPWLDQVIEIQRRVAMEQGCAFWNWRQRMGGAGAKQQWVFSGYAQGDYVHFTGAGYELVGRAMFSDLMLQYDTFLKVREEPENEQPGQDRGDSEGSVPKP